MRVLDRLGGSIARRPKLAVAVVLAITLMSMTSVALFGIDQSFDTEDFMPDDEVSRALTEIEETFQSDEVYSVNLLVRNDDLEGDVLTTEAFADALEAEVAVLSDEGIAPYLAETAMVSPVDVLLGEILVYVGTTSPETLGEWGVAAPDPTPENLMLTLQNLDDAELKGYVHTLMTDPAVPSYLQEMALYASALLSSDFDPASETPTASGMVMAANFDGALVADNEAGEGQINDLDLEKAVQAAVDDVPRVYVLGLALSGDEMTNASNESFSMLMPIAFVAVVLILLFLYRDAVDTAMGLLALVIAIIWTYGISTALGFAFNPMTMVVPILIIGLGIDYSLHMVMRYREERANGGDVEGSVRRTVVSVGEALLLATVTTVVAFLSNATSPLEPMAEFGYIAAIGIVSSFVSMLLLVPSTRAMRDRRNERRGKVSRTNSREHHDKDAVRGMLKHLSVPARKAPWAVVAIALVVSAGMGAAAVNLESEFDINDFLPEELEFTKNYEFMTEEFDYTGEISTSQVLVTADSVTPGLVLAIENASSGVEGEEWVMAIDGPTMTSFLTVMADLGTDTSTPMVADPIYDADFAENYSAAFDPATGLMRDGVTAEQLASLVDEAVASAPGPMAEVLVEDDGYVLLLEVPHVSAMDDDDIRVMHDDLEEATASLRDVDGVEATITGMEIMEVNILDEMDRSQMASLMVTLIVCLLLMTVIMYAVSRSFVLGGLSMVPVALCVVWMWGTMYLTGIPMNVLTLTVASLTVGMGVTYGIHITHRFAEEIEENSPGEAVERSMTGTGSSIFGAAMTTMVGFGILGFSILPPMQQFGTIAAMAILYSLIGTVLVLPSILVIWGTHRHGVRQAMEVGQES